MSRKREPSGRKKIYATADAYISKYRRAPTVRELCALTGYNSTSTVHEHLKIMKEMGCVDYLESCPRTLVLLHEPEI